MSQRRKRRIIISVLVIILSIIVIERVYNNKSEFQVKAEDASHYDIVEAKVENRLKMQDFENLYSILEENYPFFKLNERMNDVDWLENKSKYKRLIRNTKNDAEFFVAMERILGDLNDENVKILSGHDFKKVYLNYYETYARTNNFRELYKYEAITNPFVLYRYNMSDGLEDIVLYEEENLETKVLKKDNLAYIKIKTMTSFDEAQEDYIEIKRFLKDVEDYKKLIIDIRGNKGGSDTYWKDIVQLLIEEPLTTRNYSFFKDGRHRNNNDAFYIKGMTTIKLLDDEILKEFPEEIKTDFDFYKNHSIRINPWQGSTDPLDMIDFKGKIYMLVDKNVFAEAENFAAFAKKSGFATLVGQTTGGGRSFAEIPITYLLQSKFVVQYSREMVMNEDGTINMETKTTPHIDVDSTADTDFNKDECIQAVIRD